MNSRSLIHYPVPWNVVIPLGVAVLVNRRRNFQFDARHSIARIKVPLRIIGQKNIPRSGPCLLTINHYHRAGFQAWWLALITSAVISRDIRWIFTGAWTYPDRLRSKSITPLTRWLFRRVAHVYSFTTMPPMPPDPNEVQQRAYAVREILNFIRHTTDPIIGLAPEGGDFSDRLEIGIPPPGVGRFAAMLAKMGLKILPVGFFENGNSIYLRFGESYTLDLSVGGSKDEVDLSLRYQLMEHLSELLVSDIDQDSS